MSSVLSGEIHYFRVPRKLWKDRLLKLKRAGLNTVTIYIAWNFHEIEPGVFDFSNEKDFTAFIEEAKKLGLKVIGRVGPYICAEWDNGGHPDWLISRDLIPRSLDPNYIRYAERWLRIVLPLIGKYSIKKGGNLIAVQLENEYFWGDVPYHMYLMKIAKEVGIDVDMYTNVNRYVRNTEFIDALDLYPQPWDLDSVLAAYKDFFKTQPYIPLRILEYEAGWFSVITKPLPTERGSFPPEWTQILLATALAYGADLISFYMFHGGTNFGYWTGRGITTTYDYEAPIREWGELSPRYYRIKLLSHVAPLLEGSQLLKEEVYTDSNGKISKIKIVRGKEDTKFTMFINNSAEQWLADDYNAIKPRNTKLLVENLNIGDIKIVKSNLSLLGLHGNDIVFYGNVGEKYDLLLENAEIISCLNIEAKSSDGKLSIEGKVPEEVAGCLLKSKNGITRLLVVSEEFGQHTWFLDDYIVPSNVYFVRSGNYEFLELEAKPGKCILYLPFKTTTGNYIKELDMTRIELDVSVKEPNIVINEIRKAELDQEFLLHTEEAKPLEELGIYKHDYYVYQTNVNTKDKICAIANDLVVITKRGKPIGWGFGRVCSDKIEGELDLIVESTGHPNDGTIPFFTGLIAPVVTGFEGEIPLEDIKYGFIDLSDRYSKGIGTSASFTYIVNRELPELIKKVERWTSELPEIKSTNLGILLIRGIFNIKTRNHAILTVLPVFSGFGRLIVFVNGKEVFKGIKNHEFPLHVYIPKDIIKEGTNEVVIATPDGIQRTYLERINETKIELWRDIINNYNVLHFKKENTSEVVKNIGDIILEKPTQIMIKFDLKSEEDNVSPIYLKLEGNVIAQIILNEKFIGRFYATSSQNKFYLPEPYLNSKDNILKLNVVPLDEKATIDIKFGSYFLARKIRLNL